MNSEFNFKPKDKIIYFSDGIMFGKSRGAISNKVMDEFNFWEWRRMDVFYDFNKFALAIRRNDEEGMLALQVKGGKRSRKGNAFSTLGFSEKAKRGRYQFLKQEGDMYIFTYSSEK